VKLGNQSEVHKPAKAVCHMLLNLVTAIRRLCACRYCAAGAAVCDARGTTRIVDSSWPSVTSWTSTSPLRAPVVVSVRITTSSASDTSSSSSSRCRIGACCCITDISRTSVTSRSRCAVITSPPDSRNARISHRQSRTNSIAYGGKKQMSG